MARAKQNILGHVHAANIDGDATVGYGRRIDPDARAAMDAAAVVMEKKTRDATYVVREYRASDENYILDNWTRSYLYSDVTRPIPRDVYQIEQRARIARIMQRARIMCAVDPTDVTRIKGWICFSAPVSPKHYAVVHYICVHPALQNNGIGRALLDVAKLLSNQEDAPVWITHFTLPMRRLVTPWKLIYNPYHLEVLHVYD